jgi:lambda family phage portal protein
MYAQHPGDLFFGASPNDIELRRVPAEQVIHLFDREEPGQIRGIPRLSRILLRAHDLDGYDDATALRMNLAAMFALFVTSPDESAGPLAGMDGQPDDLVFEPGTIATLNPGETITAASPPDIGANYKDFVRAAHLMLAAGSGVTYEQLTGDLSQVNYSSIRAGLIEFRREVRSLVHTTVVPTFCRRIWVQFLRQGALAGVFDLPNFATDPLTATSACWIPQGFDWVDPQKETAAARDAVRAGFRTRRSVVLEQGDVPAEVEEEFAEEQAAADSLGLIFDTDVRNVPAANPSTPRTELLTPAPETPTAPAPAPAPAPPAQPKKAARGPRRG